MLRVLGITCVTLLFTSSTSLAEKNADIAAKLTELSSPTAIETFDASLEKPLAGVKGEWSVENGVLVGKELASDKHAAVLNYQKKNRNSVVRFSFKVDGNTKGFHFSLNHAKGHLFRVGVTPSQMNISLDKDKNDTNSKVTKLGSVNGDFKPGNWYTMQIEMLGDRVVAHTDTGVTIDAKHPKLDTEKPNYRFVMQGNSLSIDDLMIWELN